METLQSSDVVTIYDENNLTKREREILSMLAKGYSNNEIADKLGIRLTTVKTHLYHAYRKMNIRDSWDSGLGSIIDPLLFLFTLVYEKTCYLLTSSPEAHELLQEVNIPDIGKYRS